MKSRIFVSIALGACAIALAGCQKEPASEAAAEADIGIAASNVKLVLPAVKGNPGAVYFDIVNNAREFAVLRKVEVAGAKEAMMHDTIDNNGVMEMVALQPVNLPKGETIKFERGGKHVMAMELDETLAAGGTTEVTFTFTGGDKLSVPATIEAIGGAN